MRTIFVLGPAGSGKTTLTHKFGKYLEEAGFKVTYINLDAAVEHLSYEPDFDIRNYVTVTKLMSEHEIGPNTALIKSVEIMAKYKEELVKFFSNAELIYDYAIVDTPGQLELVLFHESAVEIIKTVKGRACGIFLIPTDLLKTIRDLAFLKLLALAVRYRLDIPLVTVLSKADLAREMKLEITEEDIYSLALDGVEMDLTTELWSVLRKLEKRQRIIKVSSVTGEGFDDLHTILYEIYCTCGDLT